MDLPSASPEDSHSGVAVFICLEAVAFVVAKGISDACGNPSPYISVCGLSPPSDHCEYIAPCKCDGCDDCGLATCTERVCETGPR